MTTIAYDGRILAADSRLSGGFIEQSEVEKIHDSLAHWIAGAGQRGAIQEWIDWFESGHVASAFPEFGDRLGGVFVVDKHSKMLSVYGPSSPFPCVPWNDKINALGSGEQFAMGAMLAGKNAFQAVEIAAKLDTGTGGEIKVVRLWT